MKYDFFIFCKVANVYYTGVKYDFNYLKLLLFFRAKMALLCSMIGGYKHMLAHFWQNVKYD